MREKKVSREIVTWLLRKSKKDTEIEKVISNGLIILEVIISRFCFIVAFGLIIEREGEREKSWVVQKSVGSEKW